MKRLAAYLAAIVLLTICLLSAAATETTAPTDPADTEPAQGSCGDAIAWVYSNGILSITGPGQMYDFYEGPPWADYKNDIHTVIISGGVTYVGAYAFTNYDNLRTVDFGNALEEIGHQAFYSCDGLTYVTLPRTFICFGSESFMNCRNLKEFHCSGVCPHFRLNCLRDTYGTIYYPASRPWPLETLAEMEAAFHGRIEFLASDGTDPIPGKPGEPAPPPPATNPPVTVPPTTEAPTEAPTTEPATEPPVTVPPTAEAPTEAPTTEPATEPTTQPPTEEVSGSVPPATEEPVPETTEASSVPALDLTKPTNILIIVLLGCGAALLIPVILLFISIRKRNKDA